MTSYTVKVTQEHIEAGEPKICTTCPVALAIKVAVNPSYDRVAVHSGGDVWLSKESMRPESHYGRLSAKVQTFIKKYDSGEPVKPFEFVLKVRES